MKNLKLLAVFVYLLGILVPVRLNAQSERGINFVTGLTLDQVLAKAKQEHKKVFIDAYATWCAPCKAMDSIVYKQQKVGELVNADFISVKIQMDVTDKDNAEVKLMYPDAKRVALSYGVAALPCFLFLGENGQLLHKDVGYKAVPQFSEMVKISKDPNSRYAAQIESFRMGSKNYLALIDLQNKAKELKDTSIADSIAKYLKKNFFDVAPPQDVFASLKTMLSIEKNIRLFGTKDPVFKFSMKRYLDTALKMGEITNRAAVWNVSQIIANEEVLPLLKDGKGKYRTDVNWDRIISNIRSKHPKVNAARVIIYHKIGYYERNKNWKQFADAINELNNLVPFDPKTSEPFFRLNLPAWGLFKKTGDVYALNEALKWIDLAIKLKPDPRDQIQFLDTRANILYRLGRVSEAIKQEEEALQVAKNINAFIKDYEEILSQMKAGLPTWPEEK